MIMEKDSSNASTPLFQRLAALLDQLDKDPAPKRRKGPGRPTKNHADTTPVVLHLYKSQVRWLDEYAQKIAAAHPQNLHLSRADIVRGLLLGLGRFALDVDLSLPNDRTIRSERDLQHALAAALAARGKSPGRCRAADLARDRGGETTSIG